MKKAFTLAEVLITLGIIGIVAAMTLPSLINNYRNKQLETAFKKSYSNLANAIQRVLTEDYNGTSNGSLTINHLQKYYKQSSKCINGQTCSGSTFPLQFYGDMAGCTFITNNYKQYNGNSVRVCHFNDGILAVTDGSFIFIDVSRISEPTYGLNLFAIDVNGWKNKPNRYGHDMFVFQVDKNWKLLPMGLDGTYFPESQYCSLTASNTSENGYGCTAKALSDPDYFKKLPK